jgi:hypothetical protein
MRIVSTRCRDELMVTFPRQRDGNCFIVPPMNSYRVRGTATGDTRVRGEFGFVIASQKDAAVEKAESVCGRGSRHCQK